MAEPVSVLMSVATGLALAAAAGFRAFVPLLAAGLAIHFGYVEAAPGFDWLGEPIVLVEPGADVSLAILSLAEAIAGTRREQGVGIVKPLPLVAS